MTAEAVDLTVGTLYYQPGDPKGTRTLRRGRWGIDAEPHVMIRVRRLFPRVRVEAGRCLILDTPEVARDLEWFLERHPMRLADDGVREALQRGAKQHRDDERAVRAILAGQARDGQWHEPAEPDRDYQVPVSDLVSVMKRLIVTDAINLGKTHEGLATLRNPGSRPAVVVCQSHLVDQWRKYAQQMWPDLVTYMPKTGSPLREKRMPEHVDILVINYAKLDGWQHHLTQWARSMIIDEVQELRRGREAQKGVAAANVSAACEYVVGVTATPVYNYGIETWHLYDVVHPDVLGDRDEFLREWGGRHWLSANGEILATVKDPQALSRYLRQAGLMIGRTRKEVGRDLPYGEPEYIVNTIPADPKVLDRLEGDAIELARLILARSEGPSWQRMQAASQLDLRLRQATGIAKAPFVADFAKMVLDSERKIVLWGWHHAVYDIWRERLKGYGVVDYTGKQTLAQKLASEKAFVHGDARVLMMSLRSGAGLEGLQHAASVGIVGELDWSPKVIQQCGGRLAREGQEHAVLMYVLVADDGADPSMLNVLDLKEAQGRPFEDPDADVIQPLPQSDGSRMRALAEDLLRRKGVTL